MYMCVDDGAVTLENVQGLLAHRVWELDTSREDVCTSDSEDAGPVPDSVLIIQELWIFSH